MYRTDESDNTYCRDLYELSDGTYQLLASKMPVDIELSKAKGCSNEIEEEFYRQEGDISQLDKKIVSNNLFT